MKLRPGRKFLLRALAACVGLWVIGYYLLPWAIPLPDSLESEAPAGPRFVDREGRPLRHVLGADGSRSEAARPVSELPESLVQATIAAEDQRFWNHGGIDFPALARATGEALRDREIHSGASTITQQLIKISAEPRRPRTIRTKVIEMLAARHLEMRWSKDEILSAYLHGLGYGNLMRGPEAAASGYFDKPAGDLSISESAFLAGLPQAPTRLNPFRDPAPAEARRRWVLERMHAEGFVDADQLRRALEEPVNLRRFRGGFEAPHLVDHLLAQDDPGSNEIKNHPRPPPATTPWRKSSPGNSIT